MRTTLRTSLVIALLLTCLDAHARVNDKCILSLEARPERPDARTAPVDTTKPKPPCPVAVGFDRAVPAAPARNSARADHDAGPFEARVPRATVRT